MVIIGPLSIPQDGLMCCVENSEMQIDKTKLGAGTLYVTEKYVYFIYSRLHNYITVMLTDLYIDESIN